MTFMQLYGFVLVMLVKVAQEGNYKVKGEHIMQDSVSLVKTRDINYVGHNMHHMQQYLNAAKVFPTSLSLPSSVCVLNCRTMATPLPRETQLTGTSVI